MKLILNFSIKLNNESQTLINRYLNMSYCQKHTNHHCAHSHNCKDPSHKKKQNRTTSSSLQNAHSATGFSHKYQPPMGTIIDNEECHFISPDSFPRPSNLHIQAYIKQINSLQSELQQSKSQFFNSDIENRKLKEKNSHLECQIQYLRQQVEVLINNHNTDIHKEIKRSLIENTQLNIKIKELTTALFDKEKLAEQFSSQNYSLIRKNKQLQAAIKSFEEKVKMISLKNQELSFQNTALKNKIKQIESQLKVLKNRYLTLATSADRSEKQKETKLSDFDTYKQKNQRLYKAKDSQLKRIKQLHEVEKKAWQKMISELKENMQKKDDECKRLRQMARQSQESLNQAKQDLEHAKKMILKYEKVNVECQKVRDETKKIQINDQSEFLEQEKKTVSKIQSINKSSDEPTLARLRQVQKINRQLEQKIKDLEKRLQSGQQPLQNKTNIFGGHSSLQTHTTVINEELILSIGASQQFKKIVQQKNATIKKLMREKVELHNKIYEQQVRNQ